MASAFDTTLAGLGITRSSTAPAVGAANSGTTLGQADFLRLMTAQLNNQDPFDPVDNTQMVAQMAQFSSLAGITEMSSTLKAIADKLGASSPSDAVGYIGRTVLTEGGTAFPRAAGGIACAVALDAAADQLVVQIADAQGQVLRTVDLGRQKAGTVQYDWDGKTDAGEDAGAGPFSVTVAAAAAGQAVPARGLVWAPVQSVSTASGQPVLDVVGLGTIPVTAVRSVG